MSDAPIIPANLTLPALQQHIRDMCAHMNWNGASREQLFLLFAEEVGELAKAIRNATNLGIEEGKQRDAVSVKANLAEEFADVLSYLVDLANKFDIDLDAAYRAKSEANLSRRWG